MTRRMTGTLALIFVLISTPISAELIKKSNSGLCHPPESAWYERTKSYTEFDSLQACLNSGGAAAQRRQPWQPSFRFFVNKRQS